MPLRVILRVFMVDFEEDDREVLRDFGMKRVG